MSTTSSARPIAVIGAGTMGSGLAQKIAQEGLPTIVVDAAEAPLERGRTLIKKSLDEAVARKILDAGRAEATWGRITFTTDYERTREAALAIEAVFEDPEAKRKVFTRLDEICLPDTILATNTSSLHVRDLAAMTRRPDRVLGLHYFYHPAKNRLVELIPTATTSRDTIARASALQAAIGKTEIRCADAAGFVVNRYFVPWLNEAVRLLAEGVADIPTIEAAARQAFGVGMGPFQLMNVTGVPIALHSAATLGRELGPLYAPEARLSAQVDSGQPWDLAGTPDPARFQAVADRLDGVVSFVAASLVAEGVASIEDTDIGARVGLRWPRGPFERMNDRGTGAAARLAAAVAERWTLEVPVDLASRSSSSAPYAFQRVRLDVEDGLATITVNRPDALNALNEEVIAQLDARVAEALGRADVKAVVLRGAGKAFVAGADIKFFVDQMAAEDYARIDAFARAGQKVLAALSGAKKPTIAVLDGLSLGGGTELALGCHYIIATERGSLAFPETGIGIYPGLGGTQRTTRRVGVTLAKVLVLTGQMVDARTAAEMGLVDRACARAELDAVIRALTATPLPAPRSVPAEVKVPARLQAAADLLAKYRVADLLGDQISAGGDAALEKVLKIVRSKAPIALRLSEMLVEQGAGMPLDAALELENTHAREVFASRDAREGMAAVLGRRRPAFTGT